MKKEKTPKELLAENEELKIRLQEAEDTLQAIRNGEVDAVVVAGSRGQQIFTLTGQEQIYRQLVETMHEAGLTATPEGQILFCNERFSQMLQKPMEDIIGRPLDEFVLQSEHKIMSALLVSAQMEPARKRLVFIASDGTLVPARVSANPLRQLDSISICLVAMDLSELEASEETIRQIKEQQDQLREIHYRLELAAEAGDIGTWEFEVLTKKIIWDNRCKKMFGLMPQAEVTYELFLSLIHPDDRKMIGQGVENCTIQNNDYKVEFRAVLPNGTQRWFYSKGRGIFDDSGNLLRLNGVVIDITERRKNEEDLKRFAEELKRSNSDLEQFAYVASHDMREPLRAITGFMALLSERYKGRLDEKADKYITYAVNGAKRMDELLSALLEYSHVQTHKQKHALVLVQDPLKEAMDNLRHIIVKNQAIIKFDALPTVKADDRLLMQLFQNLIQNAIKFKSEDRDPEIHIGCKKENRYWLFWVKDNGIGIEPQHYERIFNVFSHINDTGKYAGSGIGLSVCKKIVERHGGRIWVESEIGNGSTFYFTIPA